MLNLSIIVPALLLLYILGKIYRLSPWHPLSHIQGPWYTAISSAWLQYHTWKGTQASATRELHRKYGPIIRTAPNEVEIADGAAVWPIYIQKGGFNKSHHYAALNIDGHPTVFSTLQNRDRAVRLSVALPFFSAAAVQKQIHMLEARAAQLLKQFEIDRASQDPVDLLDRCRCYALDTTSTYVFGEPFGALDEGFLAIAPVVDSFLEQNLLFNVPRAFRRIASFCFDALMVKASVKRADARVDAWIRRVVGKTLAKGGDHATTYPSKLSNAGLALEQVVAEGKDAIFGATDALGLVLSMIIWRLVSDDHVHSVLKEELDNNAEIRGVKLQSLPFLTGIIKETMRMASTVPCKLPRVTPPEGMVFENTLIPGGVVVGVAPYMLHTNEAVFRDPHVFDCRRWDSPTTEMTRDWMPFGKGSRACMGRHLALMQTYVAVAAVVRSHVLDGASVVKSSIQFREWYNVKVVGDGVEVKWRE
ncbi:hypothetical protein CERZMDRAFT_52874 [Cercospora zeae-maydis SCOH1-5]|uniref:Cytochrome P450 n=1 Tax=Cercospora zeae-maydis SCOH1-5 TaxID=717836 RepID=A0A6A6EYW4_9PEZI|nr:hypothetical protein CERZMDRAFT_52874 [Cercospora zeae-maydis SCOH1-5]